MLSISILAPNWHEMVLFYSIYQTKTSKHAQSPRTTACNFHVTLLKKPPSGQECKGRTRGRRLHASKCIFQVSV